MLATLQSVNTWVWNIIGIVVGFPIVVSLVVGVIISAITVITSILLKVFR